MIQFLVCGFLLSSLGWTIRADESVVEVIGPLSGNDDFLDDDEILNGTLEVEDNTSCGRSEPCRISKPEAARNRSFCQCASGKTCGSASVVNNDIVYDFCEPIKAKDCELEEKAWVTRGYHMKVKCWCKSPRRLKNRNWNPANDTADYTCSEVTVCRQAHDICRVRLSAKNGKRHLQHVCECPQGLECSESTDLDGADQMHGASEVFRCAAPES